MATTTPELTIGHQVIDSPIGPLLLAGSERGVLRVVLRGEDHDAALEELSVTVSPRVVASSAHTEMLARQLDEYFHGRRTAVDVTCDLSLLEGFGRRVVEALAHIPYGDRRAN